MVGTKGEIERVQQPQKEVGRGEEKEEDARVRVREGER